MLKQRLKAAGMVKDQLIPAEKSIDASLSQGATLTLAILAARDAANLPFAIGHEALEQVVAGNTHLMEARRAFVAAHRALAQNRDQLGLATRMFGDTSECPDDMVTPSAALDAERPRLHAVG